MGSGDGLKATAYDLWLYRRAVRHFIANAGSLERDLAALPWVGNDGSGLVAVVVVVV